jgi:hypothetical protein
VFGPLKVSVPLPVLVKAPAPESMPLKVMLWATAEEFAAWKVTGVPVSVMGAEDDQSAMTPTVEVPSVANTVPLG